MNKIRIFLSIALLGGLFLVGCDTEDDTEDLGNWVKYSDFEGVTRFGAVAFVIGDYAYVGLGTDGDDYLKDFWRYDKEKNFWTEVASFPGEGRISAVGLSIGEKGYVGTGFNNDLDEEELGDFWEYDPQTDQWIEKDSFPGGPRYAAVGFTLGGEGYIGTGYNGNFLKDFWKYSPATGQWTQTVSLFGSKREEALAFVIDGKAYVGTGKNNGSYLRDFWAYDAEADTWTDLTLYEDDDYFDEFSAAVYRYGAVSFVMQGKAYIVAGISSSYTSTVYSFDPSTGEWDSDINPFEGSARSEAIAFTIDDVGFVCTGRNSSYNFDDIWGFYPLDEYDEYD